MASGGRVRPLDCLRKRGGPAAGARRGAPAGDGGACRDGRKPPAHHTGDRYGECVARRGRGADRACDRMGGPQHRPRLHARKDRAVRVGLGFDGHRRAARAVDDWAGARHSCDLRPRARRPGLAAATRRFAEGRQPWCHRWRGASAIPPWSGRRGNRADAAAAGCVSVERPERPSIPAWAPGLRPCRRALDAAGVARIGIPRRRVAAPVCRQRGRTASRASWRRNRGRREHHASEGQQQRTPDRDRGSADPRSCRPTDRRLSRGHADVLRYDPHSDRGGPPLRRARQRGRAAGRDRQSFAGTQVLGNRQPDRPPHEDGDQ